MTKEEAQELIAEFKEKKKFFGSVKDGHCDYVELNDIEKIINRFANKPPKEGYKLYHNGSWHTTIRQYIDKDYLELHVAYCDREGHSSLYAPNELKHLRDNINLMLEYLDANTTI